MRNFVILLTMFAIVVCISDIVSADTLYDLYSDNHTKQVPTKQKEITDNKQYNGVYMPNYSTTVGDTNDIVKKGSKNYGSYANASQRTNPVRIGNPYNHLNEKYNTIPTQSATSTMGYDGDAVKFKKGPDGNIYGYNRYGQKIGIYRLNNDGSTTQYDTKGNRMGRFK